MAQENVDVLRRGLDATNRRDLQTLGALLTEDWELHSVLAASEGRVFRGRQGIRDYFGAFDDAFVEHRFEPDEFIDVGDGRVVALVKFIARGRESGVPLNQPFALVVSFHGGLIARMDSYFNRAEALEAVGLSA